MGGTWRWKGHTYIVMPGTHLLGRRTKEGSGRKLRLTNKHGGVGSGSPRVWERPGESRSQECYWDAEVCLGCGQLLAARKQENCFLQFWPPSQPTMCFQTSTPDRASALQSGTAVSPRRPKPFSVMRENRSMHQDVLGMGAPERILEVIFCRPRKRAIP